MTYSLDLLQASEGVSGGQMGMMLARLVLRAPLASMRWSVLLL